MGKPSKYPIILKKGIKKGVWGYRCEMGYALAIVWLDEEKEYESGKAFELGDIKGVQETIIFADKESAENTIQIIYRLINNGKEIKL